MLSEQQGFLRRVSWAAFLVLLLPLYAFSLGSPNSKDYSLRILRQGGDSVVLEIRVHRYSLRETSQGVVPTILGAGSISPTGTPELPNISLGYYTQAPGGLSLHLRSVEWVKLGSQIVAPAPPRRTRAGSLLPDSTTRAFPSVDTALVQLRPIARGGKSYRQSIGIYPFQYDEDTHTLRLAKRIQLTVKGIQQDPTRTRSSHQPLLSQSEQGYMLIVTAPQYLEALQPYLHWKRMRGLRVEVLVYGKSNGDYPQVQTENALKEYIKGCYDKEDGLRYILLVGSREDIPPQRLPGTYKNLVDCDQPYGQLVGTMQKGIEIPDALNEVFVGRYSCYGEQELRTQLQRTQAYEEGTELAPEAYVHALCMGSSDPGGGDNNETDIQHQKGIAAVLKAHGYAQVYTQLGDAQSKADSVNQYLSQGVGIINYSGHGLVNKWVTSGFSSENIRQLTNQGRYPFILDVACFNGKMEEKGCFAEQWLWAQQDQVPTGAIGILASSDEQLWNPPMCAQDAFNEYISGVQTAPRLQTLGGLCAQSMTVMEDKYGATPGEDGYTVAIAWNLFGDPSTLIRTEVPKSIDAEIPSEIREGQHLVIQSALEGIAASLCVRSPNAPPRYYYSTFNAGAAIFSKKLYREGDEIQVMLWGANYICKTSPWLTAKGVSSEPNEPSDPSDPHSYDYPLRFVNSQGAQLEGVTVTLGHKTRITDINGIALFHLPTGIYTLETHSDWYTALDQPVLLDSLTLERVYVLQRIEPSNTILSLHSPDGAPLINLAVKILGKRYTTNQAGQLVLPLPPGDYILEFPHSTYPVRLLSIRQGVTPSPITLYSTPQQATAQLPPPPSAKVYPNPCRAILNIEWDTTPYHLHLYSLGGQLVYHAESRTNHHHLNTHSLPPGVYILRLKGTRGDTVNQKVILTR